MKIAIPCWQGRVSPVLDVATTYRIFVAEPGSEADSREVVLRAGEPLDRARQLEHLGVEVVICGALSRSVQFALQAVGIDVIPHICGWVDQVALAYLKGRLGEELFVMPGCCARRRRFGRSGANAQKGGVEMPRGDGTGPMGGGGRGQGRGRGQGQGAGGALRAGPGGECVCSQCGYRTAHVPGQPCNQQTCPKCRAMMIRG